MPKDQIKTLRKKRMTKKKLRESYLTNRVSFAMNTGTRNMRSGKDYERKWKPEDYE